MITLEKQYDFWGLCVCGGVSNHLSFIFFKLIFYLFLKIHIFLLERECVSMHKPRKGEREREKGRRLPAEWKAPHRVPGPWNHNLTQNSPSHPGTPIFYLLSWRTESQIWRAKGTSIDQTPKVPYFPCFTVIYIFSCPSLLLYCEFLKRKEYILCLYSQYINGRNTKKKGKKIGMRIARNDCSLLGEGRTSEQISSTWIQIQLVLLTCTYQVCNFWQIT